MNGKRCMYARNSTLQQAILSNWIEQQLQMSELCSKGLGVELEITSKKGNETNGGRKWGWTVEYGTVNSFCLKHSNGPRQRII